MWANACVSDLLSKLGVQRLDLKLTGRDRVRSLSIMRASRLLRDVITVSSHPFDVLTGLAVVENAVQNHLADQY